MKILALLLTLSSVSFSQWTTEDQIQTLAFQVLNLADAYTTNRGLSSSTVREGNPLLGSSPERIILSLGIVSILEPIIFSNIPAPDRRWMRYVFLFLKTFAVGNNVSIIVRFNL